MDRNACSTEVGIDSRPSIPHFPLMYQRAGQDVDVHLEAIRDLIAAATAAALSMSRVVQAVLGIDHSQPAAKRNAFQRTQLAVLRVELLDLVDHVEQRVVHRQRRQWLLWKDRGHFFPKRS